MAIWRAPWISFLSSSLRAARSSAGGAATAGRGFSTSAVPPYLEKVGFIGLGNMGFHMANNLINAGYKVTVHDINQNVMDKFLEKGVPTKETPFDVAESSDVIITMLPSSTNNPFDRNPMLQPSSLTMHLNISWLKSWGGVPEKISCPWIIKMAETSQ